MKSRAEFYFGVGIGASGRLLPSLWPNPYYLQHIFHILYNHNFVVGIGILCWCAFTCSYSCQNKTFLYEKFVVTDWLWRGVLSKVISCKYFCIIHSYFQFPFLNYFIVLCFLISLFSTLLFLFCIFFVKVFPIIFLYKLGCVWKMLKEIFFKYFSGYCVEVDEIFIYQFSFYW